jgi:hypothetical protein
MWRAVTGRGMEAVARLHSAGGERLRGNCKEAAALGRPA